MRVYVQSWGEALITDAARNTEFTVDYTTGLLKGVAETHLVRLLTELRWVVILIQYLDHHPHGGCVLLVGCLHKTTCSHHVLTQGPVSLHTAVTQDMFTSCVDTGAS